MQGLDQTLLFNWLPMFLSTLLVVYSGFYFYAAFRNLMGSLKGSSELFEILFFEPPKIVRPYPKIIVCTQL